jgi:phosphoribosyl 1,2-cyclic phosphodiesterase
VGVAHDLGAVPDELYGSFARCDALLLEANHDAEMLRTGPYTPALQERVRGGRGHLSNAQGAALAASVTHPGLRAISLLHLSAVNNTPELAEQAVTAAVRRAGFARPVLAAPRREPRLAFAL